MSNNNALTLLQIIGLALIYFLSSQLCSFIGVPSEFGTVIWPSAGISLAFLIIYGLRLWPGVFIGAFLADLYFILHLTVELTPLSFITAGLEAGGATLEALVGVLLMKNLAHFPNPLYSERQIGLFLISAFFSCFISSSVAITTLAFTHQIPLNSVLYHWMDWYLGDVTGIFIFTPLLLIWLHSSPYFIERRITVTVSTLLSLTLTVLLVSYEFSEERKRVHVEFEKYTQAIHLSIEKQLLAHFNSLNAIASLYKSSMYVSRREFSLFVTHLFPLFKGIKALEFSQVVTNLQRKEFEASIQKEGFYNFQITERDKDKNMIPAAQRDYYVVVNFIEPMRGNEKVFGFDTLSEQSRQKIFNQARDSGKLVLTPKLTLVQEKGSQSGVLAILPIYRNGVSNATVEEKRKYIIGFIVGVFRIGDMLEAALEGVEHNNLHIQLFDLNGLDEEKVLFEKNDNSGNSPNLNSMFEMFLGERIWKIQISATKSYIDNHDQLSSSHIHVNFSWYVLLMGLIITSLIGNATLIITGRKKLLEEIIQVRTSELQLRTAELEKSEQNFRTMANAAPVLIWLARADSTYFWFNQVWLDFVGRSIEEESGNGWIKDIHPDDFVQYMDEYITNFNLRLPFKIEYRFRHYSGEYRWLLNTGIPHFNVSGDFDGYIGSCIDITELKDTQQIMSEAKEAAESLAQSKTDFLANMSHEIRTPMNAILGLSELALHSKKNNQKDYLEKIYGASENLLIILNDILEFSKLESKGVQLALDYFNLGTLINNLKNLFEEIARQKNITFHLTISPDIERHLIGDALRLQQVLTNLLNNSIKFTQAGFVRLDIAVYERDDENILLKFSIQDSGIGISSEQQKILFQPFIQADTSITRHFGGTGLGLVISQKFVNLMGGEIFLESTLNQGSDFWFIIPFGISKKSQSADFLPTQQNKRATAEELVEAAKPLLNKRVLLVEDMPLNQQVASEFLKNSNLIVTVASNGREALESLQQNTFDLILMDVQMPVMDGFEATKIIRDNPKFTHLPIIAMSAGVTLDEQEKCEQVGMSDFIAKPINPLQMLEKIAENLKKLP